MKLPAWSGTFAGTFAETIARTFAVGFAARLAEWTRRTQFRTQWLIAVAAALAFTFGIERAGWLQTMEQVYYDYWHHFAGKRAEATHTAVVAVDDVTLLQLKDDPLAFWAPYFAQVMETLDGVGAKAVGLDFIYTVSAESWLRKLNLPDNEISRTYDAPLRAQFVKGHKVLISHLVENSTGELELLAPPQDQMLLLPRGAGDTGIANLYPDSDKLVRHYYPVFIADHPGGASFGVQLALRAIGGDPGAQQWTLGGETLERSKLELRNIGYVGPPGTVHTVSMSRLLDPRALQDPDVQALKGRTVIIAANNAGTSDRHFTPYSRGLFGWTSEQMTGGEIHANIVETLVTGRYPRVPPSYVAWLYVLVCIMLGSAIYLKLGVAPGFAAGIGFALVVLAPAYLAFLDNWVLPVATVHAGLGLAFLATLGLRLTGEERERARLKHMFGRYVSDEVVETLLSDADRPDLSGEERHVTVLFSDIRNFTTLSEQLDAREVVELLNEYFSRVCEPIFERGGMVNKYIGDAVMAVFGAPKSYPDHARRAVAAGLDMVKVGKEFGRWVEGRFPGRPLPKFAIGVGMHTGECVVGDIGSEKRTEFTAIGDTVNAASRLEGVTKDLGVWMVASAATVAAAGEGVHTGKRQTVHVKGRVGSIEVFEVTGLEKTGPGDYAPGMDGQTGGSI